MFTKIKPILLMLLASIALAACGQKGPLYKSPTPQDNQTEQVSQPAQDTQQKYKD
ncbi:lipoprotein [Shewanella marisflavi]|uniref:LPS translocon maturation chaperone LptM n=1 Tax=Shewanella marisflavi TaxID=260364 RepID=UPI002010542C|nr:lipoprotein [Shewanella marisflavi]MCL1042742.1 lipoprotein [Shewanella marisflavi]